MDSRKKRFALHSIAAAMALSLAACGGGSDDNDGPGPGPGPGPDPQPPVTETLTGQVARNGTLKNVVVCMDLNGNDACDAGEPASDPTGADGKYSLSYNPQAVPDAASARLIAPVKTGDPAAATTAIDSYDPAVAATTADYVLQRPAGSGGAINPLTTLVQTGVAAGMTEAAARANVALQLSIDAAKIEGYQDDPVWDDAHVRDTARTAAAFISSMLRTGVPLEVGDQLAAAPAVSSLRQLSYGSPDNYYLRTLDQQAKEAGSEGVQVVDTRSGRSEGQARSEESLYGGGHYLTANGWTHCNRSVRISATVGNPSRSTYCGGETSLSFNRASSVAGQAMVDLVDRWQAMPSNTITINPGLSTAGLKGALGNTAFPTGAAELTRTGMVVGQTILIDNTFTRGQPQSRNTLESVIDHYSTAGAASPTGGNTLSLAVTTSALRNLRVSFTPSSATAGAAQYYECDLNEAQTVVSNCAASVTGTYSIDDVNGQRVLRFAGQPPTPALNYHVVYTQIRWNADDPESQWVYRAHETKPDLNSRLSTSRRLNRPAWEAMKAQLGL